jgi:ATP-dependent Lon protease
MARKLRVNDKIVDDSEEESEIQVGEYPVLPLRDVVVFPHMVIPLFVGRKRSIKALEVAMRGKKKVLLVAQRTASQEEPIPSDLYTIGCIATVLQLLKLPDGTVKVLVEGEERVQVMQYHLGGEYFSADVEFFLKTESEPQEAQALARTVLSQFERYVRLNHKIPAEILSSLSSIEDLSRLGDSIAAQMILSGENKQALLEITSPVKMLERLMSFMGSEIDLLELEKKIRRRVKNQMEKTQREYYLKEQLSAIHKELGEEDGDENQILEGKIKAAAMPEAVQEKALAELKKLRMMSPMAAEATVSRNYLDTLLSVPWGKRSKLNRDLQKAEAILNADHYGLDTVKEQILEYLAVQLRVKKLKGPVLCLVGPPGVGKTSLGRSIARATGREFARMSLGGVRDEAEIRGHRRTYIGALPGKIIQKITKTAVSNPLFLLDEVDKMGRDNRGDPSAALLEVLDPEQNDTFNDHYLEVDYDLSDVMFIATSNSLDIPVALLDRMEVIRIPGYTEDEKFNIAKRHLIPKQQEAAGLKKTELIFTDEALIDIIRFYTREAGVRSLERAIGKISRKIVRELDAQKSQSKAEKIKSVTLTQDNLSQYLGVKKHRYGLAEQTHQVGHVSGLAWTETGGELLQIEVARMLGKGKATYTGSLGEVMQESIQTAMTVVRSRAQSLGLLPKKFDTQDIHVHVPEGATPKDGPSAGIGMCTGLVSVMTGIPVRCDVAMTGEITLRGEVLPIGGLKEKLLAAHRGKIKIVIIPQENERDLKEVPENIKSELEIKPVRFIDEVLAIALTHMPIALSQEEYEKAAADYVSPVQQNLINLGGDGLQATH